MFTALNNHCFGKSELFTFVHDILLLISELIKASHKHTNNKQFVGLTTIETILCVPKITFFLLAAIIVCIMRLLFVRLLVFYLFFFLAPFFRLLRRTWVELLAPSPSEPLPSSPSSLEAPGPLMLSADCFFFGSGADSWLQRLVNRNSPQKGLRSPLAGLLLQACEGKNKSALSMKQWKSDHTHSSSSAYPPRSTCATNKWTHHIL